ncbi:hypothetical protein K3G63_11495 [Hymenobacter sp. HSC-4F20]|uniref:hypothetical protein n=1 Tax=Hymenobacter sp. HSC-4F20 TaxID=2864135 RepID=UPI001C73BE8E|nr:hypothetical protein [Hymenobacter sp. HSC-4F20]MBX0291069.1 hypothetical protein [Hymenobacter sp. HSC-4F20]
MRSYRIEDVQLKGWEAEIAGLWLAENDDWLLLRYIPVDYVTDGYVLIAKQHIASRIPKKGRTQTAQVLKLKGVKAEVPLSFEFTDTADLLRWTEQQYGLIHFMEEEQGVFLGWLNEADSVHFWIDTLEPEGTVAVREADEAPFELRQIRLIVFDDDYSQSLKLLWQHKSKQALVKFSDN